MSSVRATRSVSINRTSRKTARINLRKLHPHANKHSKEASEEPQTKAQLTSDELQKRELIEQYIFSKLEAYAHKPRLWQIARSTHIKRRLLDKSQHLANRHSVSNEFVRESINRLFDDVDKHIVRVRHLLHSTSYATEKPNVFFQTLDKTDSRWYALQLQRALEVFPEMIDEDLTDNERIQKYYRYIIDTLTPKPDATNTNCIAQLRNEPFDLDQAYAQAESTGKDYLEHLLEKYHLRSEPDLDIIQQMIDIGFTHMRVRPSDEEFNSATSFLTKIAVLHKSKKTYECNLKNMGDDFMLLRFGKVFGPSALQTTASCNEQFIYFVHLFIKSVAHLMMLMKASANDPEDIPGGVKKLISSLFSAESNPSIIKLNDDFFSPKVNVDQWTWLIEKWRDALKTFPMMLTQVGSFGRLLRTTIGIGIARIFNFSETVVKNKQMLDIKVINEQFFHALQMGFYFGIAYAIVDCIQDEIRNIDKIPAHHFDALRAGASSQERLLTPAEMIEKWTLTMEKLLSGEEFDRSEIPKTPLTPLLLETFDGLITLTKSIGVTRSAFNELALLLRSQRVDKKTPEEFYNDTELFLGAVLKSHFTYTCTTFLGNIKSAREESERLWIMPFLGQLTDDCRDFYDDVTSNSVTSFTHYANFIGREKCSKTSLLNPFYAFLHLCIDLYIDSDYDEQTGAFLGRRIARTLRSIEIS
ncbi:unnamed protein product, partial [Adineta ricciae]